MENIISNIKQQPNLVEPHIREQIKLRFNNIYTQKQQQSILYNVKNSCSCIWNFYKNYLHSHISLILVIICISSLYNKQY